MRVKPSFAGISVLAYVTSWLELAPLTASAFNVLAQYANSPGHRAYCYTELIVNPLAVAVTIASTHFAYPRMDVQAELAWVP